MPTTPDLWKEITMAALLGTQRKAFAPARPDGALGLLLAETISPDEAGLLRLAAVTSLHRRAGKLPAFGNPTFPSACPPEKTSRCSPLAGSFLAQVLEGGRLPLLEEWLDLAAGHHQRIREEYLPLVFAQAKLVESLREKLLPVLGERGRWLAGQNPDWRLFIPALDEKIWQEGQRKERLVFLRDLRAVDPGGARDLLVSTWTQEPPAERAAFLGALENRLSMADEAFLESVLDDRRKDVRQAAAGLLANLPKARLVGRMTERARKLVTWKIGLLRSSLEVNLPEACDPAMLRDGIESKPPAGARIGEKAWWLAQILSIVPPRTWSAAWGKRPAQILDMVRKHEWEDALLLGWTEAAERFTDSDWLEALIGHELRRNGIQRIYELFPRLPAATQENLIITLLQDNPSLAYDQPASVYLSACRHSWSEEMTQAVTSCICANLQRGDTQPWRWEKLLRDVPPYFHPGLLDESIERIGTALKKKIPGDPFVSGLLNSLQFRLEMRRAF
jgi:hypothetical protein